MSIGFIPSNDNFPHEPTELAALRDAYLALFKDVHKCSIPTAAAPSRRSPTSCSP